MKKEKESPAQAVFGDYKGKILYRVSHPKYRPVIVSAPTEEAAIVAAAEYYHVKWTSYDFYPYCETQKII